MFERGQVPSLPQTITDFLCKTSYLFLFSFIYAIYRGYYGLALVPGGIFLTSIGYWRKPYLTSWRRYLDIAFTILSTIYLSIRAYGSEYSKIYYCLIIIIAALYPLSFFPNRGILHCIMHFLANIAFIALFSGKIPKKFI
jgi:hypothetical protein